MLNTRTIVTLALGLALGAGLAAHVHAEPNHHTTWEYAVVEFHGDYDGIKEYLAERGAQGYELILISPQETVAIFKRPR